MKRVLVVDDDATNREMLRALLTGHGFDVLLATHGREALAAALPSPPDLLVTDLLMPEMDGYTLLQHWRAHPALRDRPVVVYTATYTDPKDEALALRMGADAFLVKPMAPEPLLHRLMEVLASSRSPAIGGAEAEDPEQGTLRLYNEVLVRKLESKTSELEDRVAELTRARDQLEQLGRRHAVLSGTNQAIVHSSDRGPLLETVCRVVVEHGGATLAWAGLVEAATGRVAPVASWGPAAQWLQEIGAMHVGGRRTPAELALSRGEIFLSNDALADPALAALRERLRAAGLHSAAACPLRIGHDVVGVFTVLSSRPGFFDDFSLGLLHEVAGDVSYALENFEKEAIRREAEAELNRLNADLEARIEARTAALQAANEELRTFSYSVSHDLRAPLAAISGFTVRALEEPGLPQTSARYLDRVQAAAGRMGALIEDLLALAHVSQHEVERNRVDLSSCAAEAVESLRAAEPGRAVDVRVEPGMGVSADPGMVRIVLDNLVGNAWKFTSRQPAPRIEIGRRTEAGESVFFVSDNGDGFDPAHADKLFTPFQRLHRAGDFAGTGIGLSIVQRIVRKHGGKIGFEAAPGQGATFWFTLGDTARRATQSDAGR